MIVPKEIKIVSDGNVLKFKDTLKPVGGKETLFIYEYTKSKTKKGTFLGLNESDLQKLISTNQ